MNVADIMTRDVITVKKNAPLKEAAGFLAKFRIHGMPVTDDENKVVGIITESDFFTKDSSNIYLPTFLDFIKGDPAEMKKDIDTSELEKKTTVADIMSEGCLTVRPDMTLEELILLYKEKNFNSLPVVDSGDAIVGIVTVMDVIKLL